MNILFDIYDATGGLIVEDTEKVVTFDNFNLMANNVSLLDGEISVQQPYLIQKPPDKFSLMLMAKISIDVSAGNSRTQSKAWIEADTGSGYQIVSGSIGYIYNRTIGAGWGTVLLNSTLNIEKIAGFIIKLRIKAQRIAGTNTLVTLANASNFIGLI